MLGKSKVAAGGLCWTDGASKPVGVLGEFVAITISGSAGRSTSDLGEVDEGSRGARKFTVLVSDSRKSGSLCKLASQRIFWLIVGAEGAGVLALNRLR